jgi:hypothetical protein
MRARQQVKKELKRRGEKVSHYAASDITRLAEGWLAQHGAELMPDCVERAKAMILSGALENERNGRHWECNANAKRASRKNWRTLAASPNHEKGVPCHGCKHSIRGLCFKRNTSEKYLCCPNDGRNSP